MRAKHSRARQLIGALGFGVASACASSTQVPGAPGAPTSARQTSALVSRPTASEVCGPATSCEDCVQHGACEWCTASQRCSAPGTACAGLSLSAPAHCINDPSSPQEKIRAELEARLGVSLSGMQPDAPPIRGRLEAFAGVVHAVERGKCYFMLVQIAEDAQPGDARTHFQLQTKTEQNGGLGGRARAGDVFGSGRMCPLSTGTLRFYFATDVGPPLPGNGTGAVSVQVWSEPIDSAQLQALEGQRAELLRRIDEMPADCDGYSSDCGNDRSACDRDCWRDYAFKDAQKRHCEKTCEQFERDCLRKYQRRCGY